MLVNWTIVTVIGYGNVLNTILPITLLLDEIMYQIKHNATILKIRLLFSTVIFLFVFFYYCYCWDIGFTVLLLLTLILCSHSNISKKQIVEETFCTRINLVEIMFIENKMNLKLYSRSLYTRFCFWIWIKAEICCLLVKVNKKNFHQGLFGRIPFILDVAWAWYLDLLIQTGFYCFNFDFNQ